MNAESKSNTRRGYCPVYDIECPSGDQAAEECEQRFRGDYNPLTSFRDAEIEHCAIYRKEQSENQTQTDQTNTGDTKE
jgi:hypothetical protein